MAKKDAPTGLNPQSAIRNPKSRGFTLLEIILAVGLVVLLSGAVYAFYQEVLQTRGQIHQRTDAVFAERRVMDTMADELSSAIVYPLLQMGMSGNAEDVTFLRTTVIPNSAYAQISVTGTDQSNSSAAPAVPQHDIQLVTYRLNRWTDQDGVEHIGGLERTCQRTIASETAEEGDQIEVTRLTDQIRFLRMEYYDGSAWVEGWADRKLPSAVRVTLGRQELPENVQPADYPYETVSRTIALPAGAGVSNE